MNAERMKFGRYSGLRLADVPIDYLRQALSERQPPRGQWMAICEEISRRYLLGECGEAPPETPAEFSFACKEAFDVFATDEGLDVAMQRMAGWAPIYLTSPPVGRLVLYWEDLEPEHLRRIASERGDYCRRSPDAPFDWKSLSSAELYAIADLWDLCPSAGRYLNDHQENRATAIWIVEAIRKGEPIKIPNLPPRQKFEE